MGCGGSKSRLMCPKCDYQFINGEDFLYHLEKYHNIKEVDQNRRPSLQQRNGSINCPKCDTVKFKNGQDLLNHLQLNHAFLPGDANPAKISCPKCNVTGFESVKLLIEHCDKTHTKISAAVDKVDGADSSTVNHANLPRVGDKVLAMWVKSKWQYFDATIIKFMPDKLLYEIEWDDQDSSGRIVDYFNLALNKEPSRKEIGVGSIVLFHQGRYRGQEGVRLGGVRWHQGQITRCYKNAAGIEIYDGCHTKGAADGKWVTYKDYEYTFTGHELDELRVGPNVFDIIEDDKEDIDDIDIFFSYAAVDSPDAIKNKEAKVPQKYVSVLDQLCDPRNIVDQLKSKGLKVAHRNASTSEELKKTAKLMKKAKVFIACISDEYVANNECRMEFQYAKTTLNTPVVPLVVGDGSFEWTYSVVGMLVAGELYIHFKDKTVEDAKLTELFTALNAYFDNITSATEAQQIRRVEGDADIFVSYCWTNSFDALRNKQIKALEGGEFSDPRLVKKELESAGYKLWLDIERLRSANANASMYEQLTQALKDAKVVMPFVSKEYANSANCRLELQFAMKSLAKPIIPIVVGKDDEWKETVIGALIAHGDVEGVNLQNVTNQEQLRGKIKTIKDEIEKYLSSTVKPVDVKYRAPRIGDHVVCHHFRFAYYMATIQSFNPETLEYTVNWDDGDPSGRVQAYNCVALDVVPDSDEIGIGTIVFFQQGKYGGTEGNNTGGKRYHEGIVTSVEKQGNLFMYNGHHTKGESDGKWVTYRGYSYEFHHVPLEELRMAPSAMDALLSSQP
eukprot:gene15993-17604_t